MKSWKIAGLLLWGGAALMILGLVLSYPRLAPFVSAALNRDAIPTAPPLTFEVETSDHEGAETSVAVLLPFEDTDLPEDDSSAEGAPTEVAPVGDAPDGDAPDGDAPSNEVPSDEASDDPPADGGTPVDMTPDASASGDEAPDPTSVPATLTPTSEATAPVEEKDEVKPTPTLAALVGTLPARMYIPDIKLEAPVVPIGWEVVTQNGTRQAIWQVPNRRAAGWHNNSALIGVPGNTVFNGHNTGRGEVFRDLYKLEKGATVEVEGKDGRTYVYEVREKYILPEAGQPLEVRRENARYIQSTPDERLTLVTCHPYGSLANRLLIIAYPISELEPVRGE